MRTLLSALSLSLLGCQELPPPPPGPTLDRGPTPATAAPSPAALTAPSSSVEPPPGSPVAPAPDATRYEFAPIDWASAALADKLPRVALTPPALALARDTALPVLLPGEGPLAEAVFTHGRGWYAMSLPRERHHVFVHGTRLRFGQRSAHDPKAPPVRITRMDGIVEADFVRHGAAYTVTVECASPFDDGRCTEDAYVSAVVASLGLVPRDAP